MLDLTDLISKLNTAKGNVEKGKKELLDNVGKQMAKTVQAGTPVDTGKLRESIKHRISGANTVEVISDAEYAPFVDRGHMQGSSFVQGVHMFDKAMIKADDVVAHEVDKFLSKLNILG